MASSASMEQCTMSSQYYPCAQIPPWPVDILTFDRRQAKLLCNLGVLDPRRILQGHTTDQLGQIARTGNGTSATKRLELDVADGVVVGVDTDLQLHDVAACRGANQASTDISIRLGHGADIARAVVVIKQCYAC
jgi:hypothetical protein